jgi:hypothetical protein
LDESRHADEVVGGRHQVRGQLRQSQAEEACSSEAADGLHPAEDLLDPLANSLTDVIPDMTRRSSIDRAAAPTGIPAHMRVTFRWRRSATQALVS